jgi:hypothetical protein
VIRLRQHLAIVQAAERDRTNTLVAMAASLAIFVYFELGRRQRLGEAREETRRAWVDGQLSELRDGELGHRERAAGVRNIGRLLVGAATVAVALVALVGLLASHTI